jgi:hypothetical protein
MASDVDISNTALGHLGARAQISAISPPDGTVEAGYCARFYPIARREMIEAHPWPFATTRVTLAEVANPSTVWAYAYALPSDCIKPLRVLALTTLETANLNWWPIDQYTNEWNWARYADLFTERGSADFEVQDGTILTNEPEAVMLYRRDVTDTSKFTPMFVSSLGMLLAGYLAGPIIKGLDGARTGAQWRQAAYEAAAKSAASAANASAERADHIPSHLAAR